MTDDTGAGFELIEDDTGRGGRRQRLDVFPTESAARNYMQALTKVGAVWIERDWGWRTVPAHRGPHQEIRRLDADQP